MASASSKSATVSATPCNERRIDSCRGRPSPPEILVDPVLRGERGLEGLVGLPRSGDIIEIPPFSRSTRYTRAFPERVDSGLVQALAGSTRARKAVSTACGMPRMVYCMHKCRQCMHAQQAEPMVDREAQPEKGRYSRLAFVMLLICRSHPSGSVTW